jgi:hypothetical protein
VITWLETGTQAYNHWCTQEPKHINYTDPGGSSWSQSNLYSRFESKTDSPDYVK